MIERKKKVCMISYISNHLGGYLHSGKLLFDNQMKVFCGDQGIEFFSINDILNDLGVSIIETDISTAGGHPLYQSKKKKDLNTYLLAFITKNKHKFDAFVIDEFKFNKSWNK